METFGSEYLDQVAAPVVGAKTDTSGGTFEIKRPGKDPNAPPSLYVYWRSR